MWTERVGPSSASSTKEMERIKSWRKITKMGNYIKKIGLKLQKNNLKLKFMV